MWWPGAKIRGCYSALMKHLPADLINSSKHFTFSGVIATEISNLTTRAMYVGHYLNNQWITISLKPNQTVLLTANTFSQGNSVSNALYLICGASGADKSGSMLKLGGTFDLTINWNSGLSIGIYAAVNQWLQISALYL